MKFEIENNVIESYKRLSYDAWYAFAEFIDNSTQAYFDNKQELDGLFRKNNEVLTVDIRYDSKRNLITISDNSIGMSEHDLNKALKVGRPPDSPIGRSKYGLGMKTAACWFGDNWTITTKKLGETKGFEVEIDVSSIAKQEGSIDLPPLIFESPKNEHYTIIRIWNLNRKFVGRTLGKIRDFLSSMYRFDFEEYGLRLYWNGIQLEWQGFENKLYINNEGVRIKKMFEFALNDKTVEGWVGILGKGNASRKLAGFSIIQNKRVIQNNYRPTFVFGEQEEGPNDLVNQRVTGEIFLDGFSVSHTKDKIIWEKDEEEELDRKLGEICEDTREIAKNLRFRKEDLKDELIKFKEVAVTVLSNEFRSKEIKNYLNTVEPFPEKVIEQSFNKNLKRAKEGNEPDIKVNVGSDNNLIKVCVFFNDKSEFEPYVLIETAVEENEVIAIINMVHPYIKEMKSSDSLTGFIRHCIYDGIAEWKAVKLRGSIQPFTIKYLKDGLLRIPYEIESHQGE